MTAERVADGEKSTRGNLTTKRPGTGVPATQYFDVIGREAATDLSTGTVLCEDEIA